MSITRKHKISLITGIPLTGVDKEIIDFIEDKLSNIILFKHEDYPDSAFFMKDGDVLLEQNTKYDTLYCRYNEFWDVLQNKYDMKLNDIQSIIKYKVEQVFKQQVGTAWNNKTGWCIWVEQVFKQQVGTVKSKILKDYTKVEQAFKQKVGTTIEKIG